MSEENDHNCDACGQPVANDYPDATAVGSNAVPYYPVNVEIKITQGNKVTVFEMNDAAVELEGPTASILLSSIDSLQKTCALHLECVPENFTQKGIG